MTCTEFKNLANTPVDRITVAELAASVVHAMDCPACCRSLDDAESVPLDVGLEYVEMIAGDSEAREMVERKRIADECSEIIDRWK